LPPTVASTGAVTLARFVFPASEKYTSPPTLASDASMSEASASSVAAKVTSPVTSAIELAPASSVCCTVTKRSPDNVAHPRTSSHADCDATVAVPMHGSHRARGASRAAAATRAALHPCIPFSKLVFFFFFFFFFLLEPPEKEARKKKKVKQTH
jgi:hypothetical protein